MQPLNIPGIQNGYKVDEFIWRGAQPDDAAWPLLAAAGCKSVIDLNSTGEEADSQQHLALTHGLGWYGLGWNGILPPKQASVQHAVQLIDTLRDGLRVGVQLTPVFIHCAHGSDRTGTLCAIWRMHHDGWDFDDAMAEAFTSLGTQGMHEFWMAAAVAEFAHSHFLTGTHT